MPPNFCGTKYHQRQRVLIVVRVVGVVHQDAVPRNVEGVMLLASGLEAVNVVLGQRQALFVLEHPRRTRR